MGHLSGQPLNLVSHSGNTCLVLCMKTVLMSLLVIVLLALGVIVLREGYIRLKVRKLASRQYDLVAPLIQKLNTRKNISKPDVLTLVKDPALRFAVYRILQAHKRTDLFPSEYFTRVKGAEGFLVNWLEFPTELGNPPDEIEFVTLVTIPGSEPLDYYVFRYKAKKPPHDNWMLGIVGPYRTESRPYDVPLRVFSRFNSEGMLTAEEEVMWVHTHIHKT